MKLQQLGMVTLLIGSASAFAQSENEGQKTYSVHCQEGTRTFVSHTSLHFNDVDTMKYSFFYSYDLYQLGPKPTFGLIAPEGDTSYPTVSKVTVSDVEDTFHVKAKSQVVGGRNPHLQTVELKMKKFTANYYSPSILLINGVDYASTAGICEVQENPPSDWLRVDEDSVSRDHNFTLNQCIVPPQTDCSASPKRLCCDCSSGQLSCN